MKTAQTIDIKKSDTKDLVAWYNANSGSTKPIAKFKDRATAESRCAELAVAIRELESGSSKKGAAKGAKKSASADSEASGDGRGRKSMHTGKTIVRATEGGVNPRRENTHGHRSFEIIPKGAKGISYEDYIAAGGRGNDLAYDIDHGFVTVS